MTRAAGALQGRDRELNSVYLSGVLADDPQPDLDRNGDPVLLLMVAFRAPDTRDTRQGVEGALTEIEVPEQVAERHRDDLRLGGPVLIEGQLSGGGGIIATEIHTGPPPGPERR